MSIPKKSKARTKHIKGLILHRKTLIIVISLVVSGAFAFALVAYAGHSWGGYHWARTTNPFTVRLGDNVGTAWDSYLRTASADWTKSVVLDTTVGTGSSNPRNCQPKSGRVEVCNSAYGNNGWLGVASIWISGKHITQGTVRVNDTYFNTAKYNTPAWRSLVMCQEIGHTLGLDHQDVNFSNANLGTCQDYTNNPSGPPPNLNPNTHDYDQLQTIYAHLDTITTLGQKVLGSGQTVTGADVTSWGKSIQKDSNGKTSVYKRDLGRGEEILTFVIWAK